MQIQVNTDNHIQGSDQLKQTVADIVNSSFDRFASRITRVEVHLSDINSSAKATENDKRCVMETRLAGLQPISVSNLADTIELAVDGAAEKMVTALERTLGRLDDSRR